jgi:hypothetical protein
MVSLEPGLKLKSTTLWGIKADFGMADAISCPSKKALTIPLKLQFPKSSLARPEPLKVVVIDPSVSDPFGDHPYQLWQFLSCLVQTP